MTGSTRSSVSKGPVQLKRELGLFSAINMILAVMIGSGIFVSPATALKYSGSFGFCIIVWAVCGIISLLGALAYAELGTLVPRSGSEYAYFMDSFGPLHKFWGFLPSFVYSWFNILLIRPAEVAVIVLTFSEYLCQPVMDLLCIKDVEDNENVTKAIALVALGIITYINVSSVKLYVKVQNIFGSFKVIACLIVIGGGMYEIAIGNTQNLSKGFEGTTTSPKNIALAFYSGLWAYDGWSAVTIVTEEIKRPEVNVLRSIAIAVPIVTVLYIFMNVAYMAVLTNTEMIAAQAVAVAFGERVLGSFSFVIPLGVALSTFGCALSVQFGVTRLCYVSGQDGFMLESLSYVHHRRLTPAPAVALQGTISFIFIAMGNISQLIEFASFLLWVFYGLAMVSLLILRRTMKDVHRPYRVPTVIPIFICLTAIYLSVTPIVMDPTPKYLFILLFMLLGGMTYYWFVYKKHRPNSVMSQGSQYVGMAKDLQKFPMVQDLFELASYILKYDLLKLCLEGPKEKLNQTKYCQPAIMVCSLAAIERLKEERPNAVANCVATAGFSLGEITALVFAGALGFERALQLVQIRAEAMQLASETYRGGMATVMYGPDSKLNYACLRAREWALNKGDEIPECKIANYLYPHCKVVAGSESALQFLEANAKEFKLRRVKRLPVSGAFHSDLMAPAMEPFRKALNKTTISEPAISVYSNVDGKRYRDAEHIRRQLPKQMVKPVKWEQLLHVVYERDPDQYFPRTFECGPGTTLKTVLKQVNAKAWSECYSIEA